METNKLELVSFPDLRTFGSLGTRQLPKMLIWAGGPPGGGIHERMCLLNLVSVHWAIPDNKDTPP